MKDKLLYESIKDEGKKELAEELSATIVKLSACAVNYSYEDILTAVANRLNEIRSGK